MRLAVLLAGLLSGGMPVWAQAPVAAATDAISFRLLRQDNILPSYTLTVHGDGSAVYQVSYPPEAPKYSPYAAAVKQLPNTEVTLNVALSGAGTNGLFERVRAANGFSGGCASKAKHIADTGTKTLTYTSSAGAATCVYNYTEDKNIAALTNTLEAVAYTLDEGRKLDTRHRYDRLALDPEIEALALAAKRGDAVEFGTIGPTLRAIVEDPQVLERVRKRAANLLAQAGATP